MRASIICLETDCDSKVTPERLKRNTLKNQHTGFSFKLPMIPEEQLILFFYPLKRTVKVLNL